LSGLDCSDQDGTVRYEREQILQAIRTSPRNDDCDFLAPEILLVSGTLIDGEQQRKPRGSGGFDQLAVLESRYAGVTSRLTIVIGKGVTQSFIDTFIDENSHLGPREQSMLGLFQNLQRQFARNGRESGKEFFQGVPAFDVIEQCLNRNSRAPKHGHACQNLGISHDRGMAARHGRLRSVHFAMIPPSRELLAGMRKSCRDLQAILN
jgi:hypothetical protein